jgi:hypothetical protein
MLPTLDATAGKDNVSLHLPYGRRGLFIYQEKIRAILLFRGAPKGKPSLKQLHIILGFYIDESGFVLE